MPADPSALPPPKRYTHLGVFVFGAALDAFGFAAGGLTARRLSTVVMVLLPRGNCCDYSGI
jgi:hypothetical protein